MSRFVVLFGLLALLLGQVSPAFAGDPGNPASPTEETNLYLPPPAPAAPLADAPPLPPPPPGLAPQPPPPPEPRLPLVPSSAPPTLPSNFVPPSRGPSIALLVVGTLIQAVGVTLLVPGIVHHTTPSINKTDGVALLSAGASLIVAGNGMETAGWVLHFKRKALIKRAEEAEKRRLSR